VDAPSSLEQETWMSRADRQTVAARRRAQVLQARLTGASFEDIGRQLGVSDTRAHQLYVDALRRTVQEPADQLREAEAQRLDLLQLTATRILHGEHVLVQGGRPVLDPQSGRPYTDDGPTLAAAGLLLRISESRRKLLGLDAPARVDAQVRGEVYSLTAIDAELARLQGELAALDSPSPPADEQLPPDQDPPASTLAPVDVGGLLAGVLDVALDAAGVPQARREAAYAAAARLLAEVDQ
jgi:hypothetical protein